MVTVKCNLRSNLLRANELKFYPLTQVQINPTRKMAGTKSWSQAFIPLRLLSSLVIKLVLLSSSMTPRFFGLFELFSFFFCPQSRSPNPRKFVLCYHLAAILVYPFIHPGGESHPSEGVECLVQEPARVRTLDRSIQKPARQLQVQLREVLLIRQSITTGMLWKPLPATLKPNTLSGPFSRNSEGEFWRKKT